LRSPAVQMVRTIPFAILAVTIAVSQSPETKAKASGAAEKPVVTDVRILQDHGDEVLAITSTRPIAPAIESREAPPQLLIDLPNARSGMQHKRIDVLQGNILTIRTEQHTSEHPGKAPFLRIVVSFLVPYSYALDTAGNRLMVRLKPPEDPYVASRKTNAQGPQAAVLKPTASAAVVPVTSGVGNVLLAGQRFAAGSSITAGSQTAVLQLSRGGEVRVCPGTTLSVTPSKTNRDLMVGLSTGAMETHYGLDASADTILTPDFRILLAGPGEFDYAISTDSKGNTCVRGLPGNASSAIVSELIGDRVYQVKPSQQAVFHDGRIDKVDDDIPSDCGCPQPAPLMRTQSAAPHIVPDSDSPDIALAQGSSPESSHAPEPGTNNAGTHENETSQTLSRGAETRPLPQIAANQLHVQVDAPLVFRGKANSPPPSEITEEAEALPATEPSRTVTLDVQALPPPATTAPPSSRHGVLRRIKSFFAAIFR
jgi:AMIN domain